METRAFAGALLLGLVVSGSAQDSRKIETELTLDFSSKYVWHGLNLVNDPVFQPGISFSSSGFTVSFWGSMELTNWNEPNYTRKPAGRFCEIDTSVEYAGQLGQTGWNVGIIDYQYPGTGIERYREWFAGVSFDSAWGSPSISVNTGNNGHTGTYATLGLSQSVPARIGSAEALDFAMELIYGDSRCNRFLYGHDGATFTDVHLTASAEFAMGKGWTLNPTLHYSTLLHSALLRGEPRRSNVWVSCSVGIKF